MRSLLAAVFLGVFSMSSFAQTTAAPPVMVPSSFADLAGRVQDAVVNISTTQKIEPKKHRYTQRRIITPMPQFPPGSPFEDLFNEFFNGPQGLQPQDPGGDDMAPAPRVQSLGSGFVINAAKGYVVTNNHVIDDADEIKVILHDNTQLDATIVGRDTETDLALLRVKDTKKLHEVSWGNSDTMRVGDWILAVGNPFGLGGTVTSGIISARQRNINAGRYDDFIQTDASINRGNSGGPMFNMQGEVIGINTAIFSPTGGSVVIGFAIPSNLAKPVIDQLISYGVTKRGWIGVKIQEVTPEIAESMALPEARGALIASLTPEGPAAKAGIKQGDIVLRFNNQDISEMRGLPRIVADAPIGKAVPITVLRHGKKVEMSIVTGQLEKAKEDGLLDEEAPTPKADAAPAMSKEVPELGMRLAPVSPMLRQKFRLDDSVGGIVITGVQRNSDALDKGLRPGDVLLEINQRTVASVNDVLAAVKDAKANGKNAVLLLVSSQNNLRFVAIKLVENTEKK